MADSTLVSWTPPAWSLLGSAQIRDAWTILDGHYRAYPDDPQVAGARAAAEWAMGLSPVTPVTNKRTTPDRNTCRWESHTAAMREAGIGLEPTDGPTDVFRRSYARGASAWLFWWTGLEGLPGWLLRATPADPAAS
jgi:hypothetical protein